MNTAHLARCVGAAWVTVGVATLLLSGCAQVGNAVATNIQQRKINAALADGKSVLIAESTVFEPMVSSLDIVSVRGYLRPPLTYWRNRSTGTELVLGGTDTGEGRGSKLTNVDHYFVVEPGTYDLLGFVKKERNANVFLVDKAERPIESSLGMVKFSASTLPDLYWYKKWVPPQPVGTTVNGPIITTWYEPGRYEDRVGQRQISAMLIDMRGMVTHNTDGTGNIAHFTLKPGQLALIGDFTIEYSYGRCDAPHESARICPLETVWLRTAVESHHEGMQPFLRQVGYSEALTNQLTTALVEPGAWFANDKPRDDSSRGWYRMFRAASTHVDRKR